MTGPNIPTPCLPLLRSGYQSFTKSERRIADYIIHSPYEAVHQTISEIADATGSAEITVSRFCRKLGYSGLQSLKIALASEIFTPMDSVVQEVTPGDPFELIASKLFANISDSLQDTLKLLDFTALHQAVQILAQARKIDVYGFAISAIIAYDIESRFIRFGTPIKAFSDVHMQITSASLLKPTDVVIAISHTGANIDILESVEIAKKNKATVIAITSYLNSPLSKKADIVLHGMGQEVKYRSEAMASRLVHLAIADLLYIGMLLKNPDEFLDNMNKLRLAIAKRRV